MSQGAQEQIQTVAHSALAGRIRKNVTFRPASAFCDGLLEVGPSKFSIDQHRVGQVRPAEIGTLKVTKIQCRPGKVALGEICLSQSTSAESGPGDNCASQAEAVEIHPSQVQVRLLQSRSEPPLRRDPTIVIKDTPNGRLRYRPIVPTSSILCDLRLP